MQTTHKRVTTNPLQGSNRTQAHFLFLFFFQNFGVWLWSVALLIYYKLIFATFSNSTICKLFGHWLAPSYTNSLVNSTFGSWKKSC